MIFNEEGEAKLVKMDLPGETQYIKFGIDELKLEKVKWKDALFIKGWVFRQDVKEKKRDVYLVLKSKNSNLIFEIEKDQLNRPDVTKYFLLKGGTDNHGFEMSIPLSRLKENTYQVGFVILDETGKHFTMTSKELVIFKGSVKIYDFDSLMDAKINSNQVSIKLKIPNCNIKSDFETISCTGNKLTITGWGFLQGLDSDSMKSYVLLKKNEIVTIFSTNVKTRKDVAFVFKEMKMNLDSVGFSAHFSAGNLGKGHYQVGLYIEKGNQTGIIYADKYVDVGK